MLFVSISCLMVVFLTLFFLEIWAVLCQKSISAASNFDLSHTLRHYIFDSIAVNIYFVEKSEKKKTNIKDLNKKYLKN